ERAHPDHAGQPRNRAARGSRRGGRRDVAQGHDHTPQLGRARSRRGPGFPLHPDVPGCTPGCDRSRESSRIPGERRRQPPYHLRGCRGSEPRRPVGSSPGPERHSADATQSRVRLAGYRTPEASRHASGCDGEVAPRGRPVAACRTGATCNRTRASDLSGV
ncbi:MAG: hypothetical protein AVDCRST_MAG68-4668, partial [uncultured Gemmatimonadetes bacterium]